MPSIIGSLTRRRSPRDPKIDTCPTLAYLTIRFWQRFSVGRRRFQRKNRDAEVGPTTHTESASGRDLYGSESRDTGVR